MSAVEAVTVDAWAGDAACKTKGHVMFPDERPGRRTDWESARAICAVCPVQVDCLDAAMTRGELFDGMWGGLTPAERRELAGRAPRIAGGPNPVIAARIAALDHRAKRLGVTARQLSLAVGRDRAWWSHVKHRRRSSARALDAVEAFLDSRTAPPISWSPPGQV